MPWRVVWKANSVSAPWRLVFDESQISNAGYSLNDILAKGRNNMNNLLKSSSGSIQYTHKVAFHTDIKKIHNSIKLHERCLQ